MATSVLWLPERLGVSFRGAYLDDGGDTAFAEAKCAGVPPGEPGGPPRRQRTPAPGPHGGVNGYNRLSVLEHRIPTLEAEIAQLERAGQDVAEKTTELKNLMDEAIKLPEDLKKLKEEVAKAKPPVDPAPDAPSTPSSQPSSNPQTAALPSNVAQASVDPRKFTDYIFKEGDPTGKGAAFRQLGYDNVNSPELVKMWEKQAADKYAKGEFNLGNKDQYGQRIDIEIEVPGIGDKAGSTSYMKSGWMIQADGSIKLNTPFSGYTR